MYVCTYVCMCVCMYVCMTLYVRMYSALRTVRTYLYEGIGGEHSSSAALVGTNGSLHLRTKNTGKRLPQYIQTYVCAVRMYIHTNICAVQYIQRYIHTYVLYVRTYEHIRCTYVHVHVNMYVHTCATVYVRTYVCAQATNHLLYVDVVCICWTQNNDVQL